MKHICKRTLALLMTLSLAVGLLGGLTLTAGAAEPVEDFFADLSDYIEVDNSGAYPWQVSDDGSCLESGASTGSGAIETSFTVTAKTAGTLSFQYYLSLWGSNYIFYLKVNGETWTAIQGDSEMEGNLASSTAAVHLEKGDVLSVEFYKRFGFGANFARVRDFTFETDCQHTNRTEEVTVEPTCTEDGCISFRCGDCGLYITVTLPAVGHKGVLSGETENYWEFACSVCGETYQIRKDERLAAMTLTGVVAYFDDSVSAYPWKYDSDSKRLQSTNYNINGTVSEETITFSSEQPFQLSFEYGVSSESNWDKYTITLDGTVVVDGISGVTSGSAKYQLDAGTHDLVLSYGKDNSTSANDDRAYLYQIAAGPVCAHLHTSEIVEPATCTAAGLTTVVCDDCGERLSAAVLPALGHTGDFSYTGNGDGTHTFFCEREGCPGETGTCALDGGTVIKEPNCGENGERSHVCGVCGGVTITAVPAGGNHTFINGVCAVCGASETWTGEYKEPALDADGTYRIGTADELAWLDYQSTRVSVARAVELSSASVRLTADINMDGYNWLPIGAMESSGAVLSSAVSPLIYSGGSYTGTFDGNGHVIRNLTIDHQNAYAVSARLEVCGLFGYTSSAVIRDLGVEGGITVLDNSTHSAGDYLQIGGIVGLAQRGTLISGCYTNMEINAAVDYSVNSDGTIRVVGATNCDTYIGGVAGSVTTGTTIEDCYTLGTIRGECTRSIAIGGIVGATRTSASGVINNAVRKCYSAVDIYADPDATGVSASKQVSSYIGGIIGKVGSIDPDSIPDVEYCFALNGVLDGGNGAYLYAGRLIGNGALFQLAGKYNYALDTMNICNAAITEYDPDDSGYRSSWGRDITADKAYGEMAYTNVLWNSEYDAQTGTYQETSVWSFGDGQSYPRFVWEAGGGGSVSVTVTDLTNAAARLAQPAGGWTAGENTFTVTSPAACIVLVGDAETGYTRLTAAETGAENTYGFTIPDVTEDTNITVLFSGDANCDGTVDSLDLLLMQSVFLGKTEISEPGAITADVAGRGNGINSLDIVRVLAAILETGTLNW